MGQPRKSRKKYNTPPHPWNAERIKDENKLMTKYGLKNKKEIWKADTLVRRYRREARYLLGFSSDQMQEEKLELLGHLARTGVLPKIVPLGRSVVGYEFVVTIFTAMSRVTLFGTGRRSYHSF